MPIARREASPLQPQPKSAQLDPLPPELIVEMVKLATAKALEQCSKSPDKACPQFILWASWDPQDNSIPILPVLTEIPTNGEMPTKADVIELVLVKGNKVNANELEYSLENYARRCPGVLLAEGLLNDINAMTGAIKAAFQDAKIAPQMVPSNALWYQSVARKLHQTNVFIAFEFPTYEKVSEFLHSQPPPKPLAKINPPKRSASKRQPVPKSAVAASGKQVDKNPGATKVSRKILAAVQIGLKKILNQCLKIPNCGTVSTWLQEAVDGVGESTYVVIQVPALNTHPEAVTLQAISQMTISTYTIDDKQTEPVNKLVKSSMTLKQFADKAQKGIKSYGCLVKDIETFNTGANEGNKKYGDDQGTSAGWEYLWPKSDDKCTAGVNY
ncbi:MAG: hypothetical protein M1829_001588 [Trizodia sp. TS-e1964]|nr:MAG: hypothetical protein M1829_001588 [Trizodia sp. TS-e1964]